MSNNSATNSYWWYTKLKIPDCWDGRYFKRHKNTYQPKVIDTTILTNCSAAAVLPTRVVQYYSGT